MELREPAPPRKVRSSFFLPLLCFVRLFRIFIYIYIYNPLRWCIRACSRRDGRTRPAAKPVSRAPRRRALWCSAFAGTARTSSSSGSLAATRRRWRFFVAVFWAAGAAAVEAETPPGAAAEAWAGRLRATRQGFPCCGFPGNLHLGMRIAVHLVALGIANRVCRRVVLQIQPSPVSPDNWREKEGGGGWCSRRGRGWIVSCVIVLLICELSRVQSSWWTMGWIFIVLPFFLVLYFGLIARRWIRRWGKWFFFFFSYVPR